MKLVFLVEWRHWKKIRERRGWRDISSFGIRLDETPLVENIKTRLKLLQNCVCVHVLPTLLTIPNRKSCTAQIWRVNFSSSVFWANIKYLPNTWIRISCVSTPSTLVAMHWYRPESDGLRVGKTYTGPLALNEVPSLLHVIWGTGNPVALHLMESELPATVVTFVPASTENEPPWGSSSSWWTAAILGGDVSETFN